MKLGIHRDLFSRAGLNPTESRAALAFHCNSLTYLHSVVEGAMRVDLDGGPAGQVTADEAAHSDLTIAAIKAVIERRKRGEPR